MSPPPTSSDRIDRLSGELAAQLGELPDAFDDARFVVLFDREEAQTSADDRLQSFNGRFVGRGFFQDDPGFVSSEARRGDFGPCGPSARFLSQNCDGPESDGRIRRWRDNAIFATETRPSAAPDQGSPGRSGAIEG